MSARLQIAIDGPSGSGKSTLAKAVAKRLNIFYLDTGALYRAVGLYAFQNGMKVEDCAHLIPRLQEISLQLQHTENGQRVFLNGVDVSDEIRLPHIAMYASAVSAIAEVRAFLLDLQRSFAQTHDVVMDGRDIGTVILPHATLKLFLSADDTVRAKRRVEELAKKGVLTTVAQILAEQTQRDQQDSGRAVAPLRPADDAVLFDNSEISVEDSVTFVLSQLQQRGYEVSL